MLWYSSPWSLASYLLRSRNEPKLPIPLWNMAAGHPNPPFLLVLVWKVIDTAYLLNKSRSAKCGRKPEFRSPIEVCILHHLNFHSPLRSRRLISYGWCSRSSWRSIAAGYKTSSLLEIFCGYPASDRVMCALLLSVFCFSIFVLYLLRRRDAKTSFPGPPTDPFIGHLRVFPYVFPEVKLWEWAKQYGMFDIQSITP